MQLGDEDDQQTVSAGKGTVVSISFQPRHGLWTSGDVPERTIGQKVITGS
jgi:hypothetical protein